MGCQCVVSVVTIHICCLIMTVILCSGTINGVSEQNSIYKNKQLRSVNPYTHHKLPLLKMLKRQTRHFRSDDWLNATVTLVFHSRAVVDITWFSLEMVDNQLNKYPVYKGHPIFDVSYLRSGQVTATTLIIPAVHHDRDYTLETTITTEDNLLQYQIQTILDSWTVYKLENIDSPEWLAVPRSISHLDPGDYFSRHCKSFVTLEKGGNRMMMEYASPDNIENEWPVYQTLVQTHDDGMEDQNEEAESGTMILEGMLAKVSPTRAILDLTTTQVRARRGREGIYVCSVERQSEDNKLLDRLSLMSFLAFGKHKDVSSMIKNIVRVEVLTCGTTYNQLTHGQLHLREGKLGCVRCRGFGYPLPTVEIYKKAGFIVPQNLSKIDPHGVAVARLTNLAEVLVVEAIYIFKNPRHTLKGNYLCKAKNDHDEQVKHFDIKVRRF